MVAGDSDFTFQRPETAAAQKAGLHLGAQPGSRQDGEGTGYGRQKSYGCGLKKFHLLRIFFLICWPAKVAHGCHADAALHNFPNPPIFRQGRIDKGA